MEAGRDQRIVADVLAGDTNAYAILVKRYQKPIYNLMVRMTANEEDAFDLSQDTFLRAYEKLERFQGSRPFFPWLYSIGLNLARDFLRKRNVRLKLSDPNGDPELAPATETPTDDTVLGMLDAQRVQAEMAALSLEHREALILRYHEGLTVKEVAQAIGLTISGAKMRIHRGLLELRRLLGTEKQAGPLPVAKQEVRRYA